MALKTDMSKAYDRVEWPFIHKLLIKMGFSSVWVSWIMWCISSVKYRVLINGMPKGNIIPERGLRQGDPLSPYIFILVTEALIANVRKVEKEKKITGIKIARLSPPITHLLFADDSLFFCRANKDECSAIIRVLQKYGGVSGQQINFDKSSIQFGQRVVEKVKEDIKQVLGVYKQGGMGTYLGIPESLGGSKTQVFGFIHERLQARINGWTVKFLSKGGKEVLIKSVLTALPTYIMSCYRLPKTVTKKLTSAIAQFWWSTSGNNRGMHWMAWNKLCRHKKQGGLGFRHIEDFNTAMLAKQLWRLMEEPHSLFARVFRSRYFRSSNPLDHINSYSPSYGWRSIITARSLVKKGLINRVGTGEDISVWDDAWIPASRPRSATCKFPVYPTSFKVKDVIDRSTMTWNMPLLEAVIIPQDVAIIQSIAISRFGRPDKIGWHFTKNGKYSVKSGYMVEQLYPDKNLVEMRYGPTITSLQAFVWQIRCPPKIKHFIWQAISGCVSVSANLNSRGVKCDTQCGICGMAEETINHVLFECPPALQTWALSQIPSNPDNFPKASIFTNMDYLFHGVTQKRFHGYFPWILWYLWKNRNATMFQNKSKSPLDILILAETEGKAWELAQQLEDTCNRKSWSIVENEDEHIWKCQLDGSWKELDKFSGQGWFSFSNGSEDQLYGARNIRSSQSPVHAELEALIWAMECMFHSQRFDVVFATDCLDVVKMVSSPEEWPAFSVHLDEISRWRGRFQKAKIIHRARETITVADRLARSAREIGREEVHIGDHLPAWIARV